MYVFNTQSIFAWMDYHWMQSTECSMYFGSSSASTISIFMFPYLSFYVFSGDCIKSGPTDYERFNCHLNIFDVNVLF